MSILETWARAQGLTAHMTDDEKLDNITETLARLADTEALLMRKCAMDAVDIARGALERVDRAQDRACTLIGLADQLLALAIVQPTRAQRDDHLEVVAMIRAQVESLADQIEETL